MYNVEIDAELTRAMCNFDIEHPESSMLTIRSLESRQIVGSCEACGVVIYAGQPCECSDGQFYCLYDACRSMRAQVLP